MVVNNLTGSEYFQVGGMKSITQLFSFIANLDVHLAELINYFGSFTYLLLFIAIFCETGLFMAPFLPGDSLLFIIGALSASASINIWLATAALVAAAIIGDTVNYLIGRHLGPRIFRKENVRFLNRKHLSKANEFYKKHGGKTIVLARFIPVVRTFAPFVAGMGSMSYRRFILFNVIGGICWVSVCTFAGYFFGNIHFVADNFAIVVAAIVGISIIPGVLTWIKGRKKIVVVPSFEK